MKLLCIDTSTSIESVAVVEGRDVIVERNVDRGGIHGPDILDDVHELLDQAQLGVADLGGFVAGLGPGSFTGLRIGLATLKGLAYATGKPIYGARTTSLVRVGEGTDNAVAVLDARRQEVYVEGGPLMEPVCCDPERVWSYLGEDKLWHFVGDGALKYSAALTDGRPPCLIPKDPEAHRPRAALLPSLVDLSKPQAIATLEPVYVRKSDAEINYPDGYPDAAKRPPRDPK